MCGGTYPLGSQRVSVVGLSPRVRGTRRVFHNAARRHGLSPRVRGNPGMDMEQANSLRSIPACAGEPGWTAVICNPPRVYPRVCGGTSPDTKLLPPTKGLSPRVRGNPAPAPAPAPPTGSIPACAGEPMMIPASQRRNSVYPRVCGGTWHSPTSRRRGAGLSPRVRGNHAKGATMPTPSRSIPACAGEPPPLTWQLHHDWVYPRVCGGTGRRGVRRVRSKGLSPRVRGNQMWYDGRYGYYGSIPACAGEPNTLRL